MVRSAPSVERLDSYLREEFPAVSRAAIQRLIAEGHIRVNGARAKANHRPRAGEEIDIVWPEPVRMSVEAVPLALDILFEDEDLLVLNKAPGMVVHPSAGHETETLVHGLLHHCRNQLSGIGGVTRPGIVHRLDKETSGCLVVAKNDSSHQALAAQFAAREVEKVYHALACGEVRPLEGEIVAAIARHPTHRKQMAVRGQGREAATRYRVLEKFRDATLIEARPHTGRTHQIRVHLHHLGFPLAGDKLYGLRQNRRLSERTGLNLPRQMLHAQRLAFHHPRTGGAVRFEAPWPADFQEAVAALRAV